MLPINSENNLNQNVTANILVVDDTPANLRLLDEVLRTRGYQMRLAPDGELALKSALAEPPDLILLDIIMPGLDGYEVCSQLKASPQTRNIPIIFLSAKGEVFDKIRAFDLGAVDYITKPFSTEEVVARIEGQLKIWQLSKELAEQNNLLQQELQQLQDSDNFNIGELRERLNQRIDNLTGTNERLQQEIALREKELRDRQILETELKQQNARLQEEARERQQAQKALAKREREVRALVENAPDAILRINRQFQYLYVNPKFAEELGKPTEEIVGKTIKESSPTQSLAAFWETTVQEAFDSQEEKAIEFEVNSATGIKYYSARVVPEWGDRGEVESVLAIARDITERIAAETALKENAEFLRNIYTGVEVSIFIVDVTEDGNFRYAGLNPAHEALSGIKASELRGKTPEEVLPEAVAKAVSDRYRHCLEAKTAISYEECLPFQGRETWWITKLSPLFDSSGTLYRIVGTSLNITERKEAEMALRESQRLLQQISESSPNILYLYDLVENRNVYSNRSTAEILGYSPEDITAMGEALLATIMHPEDFAQVPELQKQISSFNDDEILEHEYRLRDRITGEWHTFFVREVVFSRTQNGKVKQILGTAVDITDRVNAEREREESLERERVAREEAEAAKEQLAQNLDSMTDIFISLDSEFRFTYVNKQFELLFQTTRSEVLGMNIWELFPDAIGTTVEREFRRALSEQVFVKFIQFWPPLNTWFENRAYPTKDGLSIYIYDVTDRVNAETLQREIAEREKTLAAAIQRIRESLDLETIFKATTEELRQALKCSRVAIYRFDEDYNGKFVAESAKDKLLLLQTQREPLGLMAESELWQNSCIYKLFQSREGSKNSCNLDDPCYLVVADIQETNLSEAYRERLAEFEIRAYLIVPIFCNYKFWGLLGAYDNSAPRQWKSSERNMALQIGNQLGIAVQQSQLLAETKRQAAELEKTAIAADAANRAKSEFLASMSHELRTPLNAILGFTQIMGRDRSLSSQNQENLKIINRAGEHLLALINDILEMSKIEAGRTTFNENCFSLTAMLESLESMLKFKAQSKGLELSFELPSQIPPGITTDEGKLRQVLINLLGNAIKFTERGKVSLRLNIEYNRDSHSRLLFEIEDTGPGIPPEDIDNIFEAFGQSKVGRKYQEGTGLGLPISKKFVELMGGELKVSSTLNQGSIFAFDVVVTAVEGFTMANFNRGRAIALASGTPECRILVVDDRIDNRYLLETFLTCIGFQVRTAENGEEALALWSSWEPHLILMDMQMPVMDGYEASKQIKATEKGQTTIIIALTASAFEEDRQKVLAAGCDDFATKPFEEELLLEKIGDRLGIKYIYENDNLHEESQTSQAPLTVAELKEYCSQMPRNWLEELYRATVMGTDETILELLEQIPPELERLAKGLEDLACNYQFEVILEAIESWQNN